MSLHKNTQNIRKITSAIFFTTLIIFLVFSVSLPTSLVRAESDLPEQTLCVDCADSTEMASATEDYSLSCEIENTLNSSKFALVFFYTEWCLFCQEQKPIIDELEQEYAGNIDFIRVDAENNSEAANEFKVEAYPTMLLISNESENGYEYQRIEGYKEKTLLKQSLDNLINGTVIVENEDNGDTVITDEHLTEIGNLSPERAKILLAIETQYPLICEEFEDQSFKDECHFELASALNDSDICGNIVDEEKANRCYVGIAVETNDVMICEKVTNQTKYKDWCYSKIAVNKKEESLCQKIIDDDTRDGCYWEINQENLDYSVCEKLKNPETKDYCYSKVAVENIDAEGCAQIINEESKNLCNQAIIERENQSVDSTTTDQPVSEDIETVEEGISATCVRVSSGSDYWYACDGKRVTQVASGFWGDSISGFSVIGSRAVWRFYDGFGSGNHAYYSNSTNGGTIVRITQVADHFWGDSISGFKVVGNRAIWRFYDGFGSGNHAYYSNSIYGGSIVRITQVAAHFWGDSVSGFTVPS